MAAIDKFNSHAASPISPALSMAAITPSDSADLANVARMIFVGTGGNVVVVDTAGNTVTHKNVASGSYIGPFKVARVNATNTTATDMIGYI